MRTEHRENVEHQKGWPLLDLHVSSSEGVTSDFHQDGFVCLSQVVSQSFVDSWLAFARRHFQHCFEVLYRNGHTKIPTHCMDQVCGGATKPANEQHYALGHGIRHGFREIVMRSPGRYEISLLERPKQDMPDLSELQDTIEPTVSSFLETQQLKLCHLSLVMATPGCSDQGWHADGGHISLQEHLPCHVLNVFVPLVDLAPELGPTELRPGSQFLTRNLGPMMLVAKAKKTLRSPVAPLLRAGDTLVFDYRTLHRGRANRYAVGTPQADRPILVLTYSKPWFVDVLNFPKRSMYDQAVLGDSATCQVERANE